MIQPRRLIASLLLAAAACLGLWRTFAAASIAAPGPDISYAQQQLALYDRYAGAAAQLPGIEQAGYVSDLSPDTSQRFIMARLALLPCVLQPTPQEPWTLADFSSDAQLEQWLSTTRWRVHWKGPRGLALLTQDNP